MPQVWLAPHGYVKIDQMNDGGELDFTTEYFLFLREEGKSKVRSTIGSVNGWSVYFHDEMYVPSPLLGVPVLSYELRWS
ncbi:MAG: hypothetical protein RL272_409 [Candidatus Parcubacteria bacterium]